MHVEGDVDKWDANGANGVEEEVRENDVTWAVQEFVGDDGGHGDWIVRSP